MLSITELRKVFLPTRQQRATGVVAIDNVSLDVREGEFFTMLGPSGCGKTTTLRCIAGLEQPDTGDITVAGRTLFSSQGKVNLRPEQRGLGLVFQSYAIWPHMDVFDTVAFPLEVLPPDRRPSKRNIAARVSQALEIVQMGHLARRPATDLSGGQQQRLALARALVLQPPLLLLDEPLSNLDAKLREDMRLELKNLQRDLGITTVYVTHDQAEALAMSTNVAVMNAGRIEQLAPPEELYRRPVSRFVADFIGSCNFLEGRIVDIHAEGVYGVDTNAGPLRATSALSFPRGDRVLVSIRPEHVQIADATAAEPLPGCFHGVVRAQDYSGEAIEYLVRIGEADVRARSRPLDSIHEGATVSLQFPVELTSVVRA